MCSRKTEAPTDKGAPLQKESNVSYHQFRDENGEDYGSFEVFYGGPKTETAGLLTESGWYWWACFPGCTPDGDPCGPFASEQAAIDNAQEGT
jgi:hypothetical protein